MDTILLIDTIIEFQQNLNYKDIYSQFSFSYLTNLLSLLSTPIDDDNYEKLLYKTSMLSPNRELLFCILKNYLQNTNKSTNKINKYSNIIDEFIKKDPKIVLPPKDDLPENIDDLTANIKVNDDDFVSETFACIFTKQKILIKL